MKAKGVVYSIEAPGVKSAAARWQLADAVATPGDREHARTERNQEESTGQ
ncbi:MAG: hypothetical protein WA900_05290 [Casimicrobiaceae bacterium]